MPGADYIKALKVQSNSIKTKHRRRRYTKVGSTVCDAGCMSQESTNHIVQKCPQTWSALTKKHYELSKENLDRKRPKTICEASFRCGTSKQEGLKPNPVVVLKEKAAIIDVTVASDSNEEGITAAYRKKRQFERSTSTLHEAR